MQEVFEAALLQQEMPKGPLVVAQEAMSDFRHHLRRSVHQVHDLIFHGLFRTLSLQKPKAR